MEVLQVKHKLCQDKNSQNFKQNEIDNRPHDPAIPLLGIIQKNFFGIYPKKKKMKTGHGKGTCMYSSQNMEMT